MHQPDLIPQSKTRRLRSGWLLVFLLLLGLQIAGLPYRYREALESPSLPLAGPNEKPDEVRQVLDRAGISPQAYAIYDLIKNSLGNFLIMAFGLLIFWRRADDNHALLISTLMMVGSSGTPAGQVVLASFGEIGIWANRVQVLISGISVYLLFFLFPDGRFVPKWTRWLVLLFFLIFAPGILFPNSAFNVNQYSNSALILLLIIPMLGSVIYSLVYRYRRMSGPLERQQIRWAIAGLIAFPIAWISQPLIGLIAPQVLEVSAASVRARILIDALYLQPLYLLFPLGIGISLLRYRLYDLDLIIRRTLVYGILSLALGSVYLGGVVLVQSIFRSLTGENSPAAVVVSTLLIAALFNPLRVRIQAWIDRRFYRKKYDAEMALAAFAALARSETDVEELVSHLVMAVVETVQPKQASVWLVRTTTGR